MNSTAKFQKSSSTIKACAKLSIPIDLDRLRKEFEEQVKTSIKPGVSENPKRIGWKRYPLFKSPKYAREEMEYDISSYSYFNEIVDEKLAGSELISSMYAIIPPQGKIGLHQDGLGSTSKNLQDRIEETVRLHIPLYTNENALMFIGNKFFNMKAGEMWMLNNYAYHGVLNIDETHERNHLIIDVIPSAELLETLENEPVPKGYFDKKMLKYLLEQSNEKKAREFISTLQFIQRAKLRWL